MDSHKCSYTVYYIIIPRYKTERRPLLLIISPAVHLIPAVLLSAHPGGAYL